MIKHKHLQYDQLNTYDFNLDTGSELKTKLINLLHDLTSGILDIKLHNY